MCWCLRILGVCVGGGSPDNEGVTVTLGVTVFVGVTVGVTVGV